MKNENQVKNKSSSQKQINCDVLITELISDSYNFISLFLGSKLIWVLNLSFSGFYNDPIFGQSLNL